MTSCSHLIAMCGVCINEYDVDFERPLFCHGDEQWVLRTEQRNKCRTHGTLDKLT